MTILRNNFLIIVIFLLGLALRLFDLGSESFWYDEAVSVAVAKLGLIEQVNWSFVQNDNNPPLYYQLMHFWVWIFGDSEFSARMPSALFGSFSIVAIYMVGRSLFNKNVGLIAALILATSVFHIKYSQEARAYSLLAFLTLVSFYYYLKILSSDRRSHTILYLLSTVLMLYSHYYGFFILAAQNIFYFGNYLKSRQFSAVSLKRWIIYQLILGIAYLPGFILFAKHTVAIQGGFWLPEPTIQAVAKTFIVYSGSWLLTLVLVAFSLLSLLFLRQTRNSSATENPGLSKSNRYYLILLWLFIPILLPFLLSLISTPVLLYRYTIGASLAFYLLIALGITMTGKRVLILILVGIILVLSFLNLQKYYGEVNKFQWRETIKYIEDNAAQRDYIAVFPIFELASAFHYREREDLYYSPINKRFMSSVDIGNKTLWVVLAEHAVTNKELLEKAMSEKYETLEQKKFKSLNLYKYRKKDTN